MDSLDQYRDIIEAALIEQTRVPFSDPEIELEPIFDRKHDRYLLMLVGWKKDEDRVHGCLVHLDIINGKIWIQRDGTEDGIATALEAAGVPKDHIVLAFRPLELRKYSEYAVV